MQPTQSPDKSDELTVRQIILVAIASWRIVLSLGFLGLVLGLILAFSMQRIYRTEVLFSIRDKSSIAGGKADLLSQFGGLASLAGVTTQGEAAKAEALATLNSKRLTIRFIQEEQILPILFPGKPSFSISRWLTNKPPMPPTDDKAFKRFDTRVRRVALDKKSGLVTLTIEWSDRMLATVWANKLVARANESLRQQAIAEAQTNMEYLNREVAKNSEVELRRSLFDLIEGQEKTLMLANASPDYIFKVIDPARVPDRDDYVRPLKLVFSLIGALMGTVIGAAIVNIIEALKKSNRTSAIAESSSRV